jgi:predicted glycoside hydrolase/deacetylase ChbG (UPF0249 family)
MREAIQENIMLVDNNNSDEVANCRLLIIHGDDLGMSHSINEASFRAFREGAISSASVMATCPWLPQVAEYFLDLPKADLGLHVTLTSECCHFRWRAISPNAKQNGLTDDCGYLHQSREALFSNGSSIRDEIASQLMALRAVGISPTHIDSHMMTAMHPKFISEYMAAAVRGKCFPLIPREVWQREGCYQDLALRCLPTANVIEISRSVPEEEWMAFYLKKIANLPMGLNVLLVHLGFDTEELRAVIGSCPGWDASWRQRDFDVITSDRFKRSVESEGINIVSWRDLQNRGIT